jgi:hypothetical protein
MPPKSKGKSMGPGTKEDETQGERFQRLVEQELYPSEDDHEEDDDSDAPDSEG